MGKGEGRKEVYLNLVRFSGMAYPAFWVARWIGWVGSIGVRDCIQKRWVVDHKIFNIPKDIRFSNSLISIHSEVYTVAATSIVSSQLKHTNSLRSFITSLLESCMFALSDRTHKRHKRSQSNTAYLNSSIHRKRREKRKAITASQPI